MLLRTSYAERIFKRKEHRMNFTRDSATNRWARALRLGIASLMLSAVLVPTSASLEASAATSKDPCYLTVWNGTLDDRGMPARRESGGARVSRTVTTDCRLYEAIPSKKGSKGYRNAVRALQASLKYCNRERGVTIDGWFGPETRKALIRVQGAKGISTDGWYGNETRDAISHWMRINGRWKCS